MKLLLPPNASLTHTHTQAERTGRRKDGQTDLLFISLSKCSQLFWEVFGLFLSERFGEVQIFFYLLHLEGRQKKKLFLLDWLKILQESRMMTSEIFRSSFTLCSLAQADAFGNSRKSERECHIWSRGMLMQRFSLSSRKNELPLASRAILQHHKYNIRI